MDKVGQVSDPYAALCDEGHILTEAYAYKTRSRTQFGHGLEGRTYGGRLHHGVELITYDSLMGTAAYIPEL